MVRLKAFAGSIVFLLLAPGTVAGLVPWLLSRWTAEPPFLGIAMIPAFGWILIPLGLIVLLESFARFALQGEGTPAPPFPTRRLVVQGFYRFVRNPMYVAVLALVFGQAFLLSSVPVLAYGGLVWLAFHSFILAYEEPTMRRSFPDAYATYFAHVPRWLPRLTPWSPTP